MLWSGAWFELAREQAAQGHHVTVYSAEDTDSERLIDGFRYRSVSGRGRGWLRSLHFLARAGTHAQRSGVDLLHFHNVPEGIWFTRKPCGVRVLSYDYFYSRRWQHALPHHLYRTYADELRPPSACVQVLPSYVAGLLAAARNQHVCPVQRCQPEAVPAVSS